jgi:hypothetical protein
MSLCVLIVKPNSCAISFRHETSSYAISSSSDMDRSSRPVVLELEALAVLTLRFLCLRTSPYLQLDMKLYTMYEPIW